MEVLKLKETPLNEVKTALFYIMELVGLNPKKFSKQELDFISGKLIENYKWLTVDEIKRAFDLGVKGLLDIQMSEVKHYHSFNTLYVSNILNSYKRYKAKENIKPKLAANVLLIPEGKKTKEQVFMEHKEEFEFIEREFNKNKKLPSLANWSDAFLHMEREGIIERMENDHKIMFRDNVIADIQDEIKKNKVIKKMTTALDMIISRDDLLRCECRKRMIINHYKNK